MKTMTRREPGGACDEQFRAETFEAMAELSQQHGMAMHRASDPAHLEAMQAMQGLMQDPEAMARWMAERRAAFEALPDD